LGGWSGTMVWWGVGVEIRTVEKGEVEVWVMLAL